jgi:hypothetical protein
VESFNKILKDHILHNITPLIETLFTINKLKRAAVGIPMGTSCALLLVDLLIFSHETDSGFSRKMKSFKFKF